MAALFGAGLWMHRNEALLQNLTSRGWWYCLCGISGVVLHWRRNVWMQALDKRFFREQYDAGRLLHAVAEEARRVRVLDQVAPSVMSHIEAALHLEFAAILVREQSQPFFQAVAAIRLVPAPLPAESCLIRLVRLLGKPLEAAAGTSDWLNRQLPTEEAELVRGSRLEWIFPIEIGCDCPETLLVLGPKRSEEPYSKEDQTLLAAVAANLALLPPITKAGGSTTHT